MCDAAITQQFHSPRGAGLANYSLVGAAQKPVGPCRYRVHTQGLTN